MNNYTKLNKQNSIIKLEPVPLARWLIAMLFLLGVPGFILVQQVVTSFHASREKKIQGIEIEVEKIAARAVSEQSRAVQIREILKEFSDRFAEDSIAKLTYERAKFAVSPVPFLSGKAFGQLLLANASFELKRIENRLKKLVPGIKLMKWDRNYQMIQGSDSILPKFVYKNIFRAILVRLEQRHYDGIGADRYMDHLNLVQRFFDDNLKLIQFVKFGVLSEANLSSGEKQYLYWHCKDFFAAPEIEWFAQGFMAVVNDADLPITFGLSRFNARKSHEWKDSGVALGWFESSDMQNAHLPHPFSVTQQDFWKNWLKNRHDGVYEKNSLILSLRRINTRLVVVAARSIKELSQKLEEQLFWLYFALTLGIIITLFILTHFRRNNGTSLSIRWQMTGLFILAMGLPLSALIYVGSELLKDRRSFYENNAFIRLEKIQKEIEKNKEYVFRHIELVGDQFITELLKQYNTESSAPFATKESGRLIQEFTSTVNVDQLFVFDNSGEEILDVKIHSSERKGLLPLVTSLAKLKLRMSGKLVEKRLSSAISLMDLMIEETGGSKLADIQAVLRSKHASAFELKFTDRRTYFFVGEFSAKSANEKTFVLVFILKDRNFEDLYLRLMIDLMQQENKTGKDLQIFYGKNRVTNNKYFCNANIKEPFFDFASVNKDSIEIGRLTEPTRFARLPVKDSYKLENGKKALLYSFTPSGLETFSVLTLFNYATIENEISNLRRALVIILLVSILILYVLTRIVVRSIIKPVLMLKEAVDRVEKGDYQCRLNFPGKNELVDLSIAYNGMTKGLDEREKMTRYLSKSAVEAVKNDSTAALGGQKVTATILFSDIRSFTTISESNSAEEVVKLLNSYFACMNEVIDAHDGDVDKFIGDAIMAQFIAGGEPECDAAAMALKAVKCALGMMQALRTFNHEREKEGKFPIKIGVGLNSGELIAGNIGAPGRMDHTVIGDTVNVASRLEGMSKFGKHTFIIISRSTLELVKSHIDYVALEQTHVKGKTSAVEMFEVISCH